MLALLAAGLALTLAPPGFHQRPSHDATRAVTTAMAGFGSTAGGGKKGKGKAATAAKPKSISAKKSWDLFRELRSADRVQTSSVYVRLPEDDAKWMNVGGVIGEEPCTRAQAVAAHKRLIFEHAARLHPKFALRPRELVCGYGGTYGADAKPSEIVTLTKGGAPPDGLRSGFQGLPHVPSGMYIVQGQPTSYSPGGI